MKTLKKLLPIIFTLAVITVMLVITVTTVSAETDSGSCGAKVVWSLDTSTGVLSITGSGSMYDYEDLVSNPWWDHYSQIKTVNIGSGVTRIGSGSFSHCEDITSVTIPDSVRSIGDYAFYDCPALIRINLPAGFSSIGRTAFYGCSKLAYISLNEDLQSIGKSAFANCKSLTRVSIPGTVTTIGDGAFYNCTGLKNVSIGENCSSDNPSGTIGTKAFYSCTAMTSAVIGDSITNVNEAAFSECDSLESITFGNNIKKFGKDVFSGSQKLTNVYLNSVSAWCNVEFEFYKDSYGRDYPTSTPFYYAENLYVNGEPATHLVIPDTVTKINDYVFYNCQNVVSITVGDSVTDIGSNAFYYCNKAENITFPASVKSIGEDAFYYCSKIKNVYIEDVDAWCGIDFKNDYSIPFRYDKPVLYLNNEPVVDLVIGSTVERIGKYAFRNCESINSITIGNSVKSIGDYAFYAINSLNEVDTGYSVEDIGAYAFGNCTSLSSITIPDSVITVSANAFNGCTSLSDVSLGRNVEVLDTKAFYGCTSLKSIFIPRSVQVIYSDTFANCNEELVIKCYENSQAHYFAIDYGYKYEILHEPTFTNYIDDNNATCTQDGTKTAYCDDGCGATHTIVIIGSGGHRYDNGCDTDCNVCGEVRTVKSHKVAKEIYDLTNDSKYPFTLSDGIYSSTNKSNSSSATFTLTAVNSGSVTIDYYTSTERSYDKLIIKHNSTTKATVSGSTSWASITISVVEDDKITLTYSKDSSQSSGNDTVYFKLSADEFLSDANSAEATCLEGVVCEVCGVTVKEALGHSFTSYVSDNNATCESDGTKTAKCDRCEATDTLTDEDTQFPHRYNNYSYNGDATCTEDGTRTSLCDYGCGRTKTKVAEKTALGHDYEKTVISAALCTEPGEALCVCTRCEYTCTESIEALGHSFTNYVSDNNATCSEDGTKTAKCDRCDVTDTQRDTGTAFGHSYDNACDADCNVCGEVRAVEPHKITKELYNITNDSRYPYNLRNEDVYYSTNKGNNTTATLTLTAVNSGSVTIDYYTSTESGYDKLIIKHNSTTKATASGTTSLTSITVSVIEGDKIYLTYSKDGSASDGDDTVYFMLSPAEIIYNANKIEATCLESVVCEICGVTVKEALGHSFTSYVSNNDATCTSDGTKTAKCDRCNVTDTLTDEGSTLPHRYNNYVYNGDATCTEDGTRTSLCDYGCGGTKTKVAENTALDHSFTNYVSNNDATCTADGTKTAKCDRCDVTVTQTDAGSALGHSWDEWYVVTEPAYETVGSEEHKCSVCEMTEQREIPVLEFNNPFTDVKESHWFYSSVEYVVKKGYMNGMSDTTFSPNSNITREQFVLILANIAGVDTNEYKNEPSGFTDVKTGQWYSGAVTWAVKESYVSGMSATKFGRGGSLSSVRPLQECSITTHRLTVSTQAAEQTFPPSAMPRNLIRRVMLGWSNLYSGRLKTVSFQV